MHKLCRVLFPVPAIERCDFNVGYRRRVETAHIDAVAVGIRARHVEGLDAANFAEKMLGDAGIESVSG